MATRELSQSRRAFVLAVEICILLIASYVGFDTPFPGFSSKGLWFYAALVNIVLGNRLLTPFFTKPVDAISYAVAAALATISVQQWASWTLVERTAFSLSLVYISIVLVVAFAAILLKDSARETLAVLGNASRIISEALGAPPAIFTVVMAFAVVAFHRQDPTQILSIAMAWGLTVAFSPVERLVRLFGRVSEIASARRETTALGTVAAYQTPNVILIRQDASGEVPQGTALLVLDEHLGMKSALVLDYVGRDDRLLLRSIELPTAKPSDDVLEIVKGAMVSRVAVRIEKEKLAPIDALAKRALAASSQLVGVVAVDTSLERLAFEVTNPVDLEEGRLVETFINGKSVMYQIVQGLTKEEVVAQKNSYGYVRAEARKIGSWDLDVARFKKVSWLPSLNTPVFLLPHEDAVTTELEIGHFPGSKFGVRIDDISGLVTHNTAILGILGVGKSFLSIELVERMISAGIKVICLDLTNQYAEELGGYLDTTYEERCIEGILEAGKKDAEKWNDNPDEGGSLPNLRQAIFNDLKAFLDPKNVRHLKIYNPAMIGATRQDSEPKNYQVSGKWQRGAVLWSVTPVEITRLVAEAALSILQGEMVDKARCCLIFEEAHSLIPEWNSAVSDGDKSATNGTARAILQGRKFGLGCLVISQRTANVTKTILNQCNTIFAMRTFDDTGMEFLGNYLGKDYAYLLPSLAERHAVLFGRASSCENPVLIRLNDRDDFKAAFRATHLRPEIPPAEDAERVAPPVGDVAVKTSFADMKDDIPF